MEEPMSPGVEEAIEESIEVREPVDVLTPSLDSVEVEPEVGQGVITEMSAPGG